MTSPDRPVIFYALASMGMGHAVRAEALLEDLTRTHTVHVFTGGPAFRHLGARFPHVHRIHRPRYFFFRGRVSERLVYLYILLAFPLTVATVAWLALRMLWQRPVALLTDFEAHSTYAALLTRPLLHTRVIALDHMAIFRFATPPGFGPLDAPFLRRMGRQHKSIIPFADVHLVPCFAQPPLVGTRVQHMVPPVRARVRALKPRVRHDGPAVVYLGALFTESTRRALEESGIALRVFGAPLVGKVGTVEYLPLHDDAFFDALANAAFVVSHAGHMMLVDALALGKPVLAFPTPGHREQLINARMLAALGGGLMVESLTADVVRDFSARADTFRARAQTLLPGPSEDAAATVLRVL